MKKLRLTVLTAGLIAALSVMSASADCRNGELCRDPGLCRVLVCADEAKAIDLQSIALCGINTAECGGRVCMPPNTEDLLHSITEKVFGCGSCDNAVVHECGGDCIDDDGCNESVCKEICTDECTGECTDKCTAECTDECTDGCEPQTDSQDESGDIQEAAPDDEQDAECSEGCADDVDTCTDCTDTDENTDDIWASLEDFLNRFYERSTGEKDTDYDLPEPTTDNHSDNIFEANAYEQEVCDLVNEIRREYGLNELTVSEDLTIAARIKSRDMHDKGYFSHNSPTFGSSFDMMKSLGISYRTAGENIAMGQRTPSEVVNAWMNSEGHRANILNASYTQIGVGYVGDGHYWTQLFTG